MWEKKVFQVALPTHNNAKTIRACLRSVNKCLEKEQWHLVVGDNNSTDDTVNIIKDIIPELSCQTNLLLEFPDAINSATAKNRVLNVCGSFAQNRPCVLGMNPDGLMRYPRIKLYDKAKEENAPMVVGPWRWSIWKKSGTVKTKNITQCLEELQFTWACTLMNAQLINAKGNMFNEDVEFYEDILLWHQIKYMPYGVEIVGTDFPDHVHHHLVDDSLTNIFQDHKKSMGMWGKTWDLIEETKKQAETMALEGALQEKIKK